jgi:Rieske Fe-S protein
MQAPAQAASEFELYGRFCGIYREAKEYVEKNPPREEKVDRDEQRRRDAMDRVCVHWACGKVFKEEDNHKKACRCHTGRWDFGNSYRC